MIKLVETGSNFMTTIGAFDAKTHLAAKGERITITRQGVPAAMLVPVNGGAPKLTHEQIVAGMRALRKRV